MISVAETLHVAFAGKWTGDDAQAIEDALDAAAEWAGGRLPLREAARFGEIADRTGVLTSAAQTQCRAMLAASLADPRRAHLLALLTALIARQPGMVVVTNGRVHHRDELFFHGVVLRDAEPPKQADPYKDPWNE